MYEYTFSTAYKYVKQCHKTPHVKGHSRLIDDASLRTRQTASRDIRSTCLSFHRTSAASTPYYCVANLVEEANGAELRPMIVRATLSRDAVVAAVPFGHAASLKRSSKRRSVRDQDHQKEQGDTHQNDRGFCMKEAA